jgi:hypothetical protein
LAEVASRRRDGEEFATLAAEFLDTFYNALRLDAAAAKDCIAQQPIPLDVAHEHALLGAIGEHLARRWGLTIPKWTNDPSRFLSMPHFTTSIEGFKATLIAESPLAFRRRLIFTEAEPLRRARMPLRPLDGPGQRPGHAAKPMSA